MLPIIEVFLFYIMTLKEFLIANEINASPDQRSRIGMEISKLEHKFDYVFEDGFNVKFYDDNFLNSVEVQNLIIKELTK